MRLSVSMSQKAVKRASWILSCLRGKWGRCWTPLPTRQQKYCDRASHVILSLVLSSLPTDEKESKVTFVSPKRKSNLGFQSNSVVSGQTRTDIGYTAVAGGGARTTLAVIRAFGQEQLGQRP